MSKKQRKLAGSDNSDSWHAILRIPSSKKEKFDDLIANQDFSKNDVSPIKLKFEENGRRGQIKIGDELFGFAVKEFPCIIEICKIFNNSDVVKIDDVTQLLLCSETDEVPPIRPEEIEDDNQIVAIKEERIKIHRHPHGLTPPMKNVVKHRFRKTKKSRYIDAPEIEMQLRGLFRRDMEASKITYQIVDDDGTEIDGSVIGLQTIINDNPFPRSTNAEYSDVNVAEYEQTVDEPADDDIEDEIIEEVKPPVVKKQSTKKSVKKLDPEPDVEISEASEIIKPEKQVEEKPPVKIPTKKRSRPPPKPKVEGKRKQPTRRSNRLNKHSETSETNLDKSKNIVNPSQLNLPTRRSAVKSAPIKSQEMEAADVVPSSDVLTLVIVAKEDSLESQQEEQIFKNVSDLQPRFSTPLSQFGLEDEYLEEDSQ